MSNIAYIQDSFLNNSAHKERAFSLDDAMHFYKLFRPNSAVPREILGTANSVKRTDDKFNLKGIQFGNWVTTEDRFNYLALTFLCFKDINKVLKFKKNNMGLNGKLALSFGARGVGSALAHYESFHQVINITRYSRPGELEMPKSKRFLFTGGAGSFAHEYGHFLDYTFGRYLDPHKDSNWLSGPYRTTSRKVKYDKKHVLRNKLNAVIDTSLIDSKGNDTKYSQIIRQSPEYWNRRLEVFARVFEQYISNKLKSLKVMNKFLTQPVYQNEFYLTPAHLKKVIPKMDSLIKEMRKYT